MEQPGNSDAHDGTSGDESDADSDGVAPLTEDPEESRTLDDRSESVANTPPPDEQDDEGLFDELLDSDPIFEDKEVLRPSYTPERLPHREDNINDIATILVEALRGATPSNILIYGKTGTGKTASAKFVSQELERTSTNYDVPCHVEYINCEVTDTQYRVLAQLANDFIEKNRAIVDDRIEEIERQLAAIDGAEADPTEDTRSKQDLEMELAELERDRQSMEPIPATGWPTDRVYNEFFEAVDYRERVLVIMLDEIDKLVEKSGDDILYNLSRINSDLENARVSLIGISNDLKFTDFLDPRVNSSLGEEEIVFPPYDADQLQDILRQRADLGFEAGVLSEEVIPLCAAFAAQEHGDARRALDLLRASGEVAERSSSDRVSESHVRNAQEQIELSRIVEVVRTLPTQSKIVLLAIIARQEDGAETMNTGEVYNAYRQLSEHVDTDVLTQRRVTDLISELDMLGIVNAAVVNKGSHGRTKEITLSVPVDDTKSVLLRDSRFEDLPRFT